MNKKTRDFLAVYLPALFLACFFTLNRINLLAIPTPQMMALNLLPLTGTGLLFAGLVAGAAFIWHMGDREFAGRFLAAGIIFSIIISALLCNFFRGPVLASVGKRYGKKAAASEAVKSGEYRYAVFSIKDYMPRMRVFIKRKDEVILKKSFMEGYKEAYERYYPEMIDRENISKQGYRQGYYHGFGAGRNAKMRKEPFETPPENAKFIERLKTERLPYFVEGYREGYGKGWQDAYKGQKENFLD